VIVVIKVVPATGVPGAATPSLMPDAVGLDPSCLRRMMYPEALVSVLAAENES